MSNRCQKYLMIPDASTRSATMKNEMAEKKDMSHIIIHRQSPQYHNARTINSELQCET